MKLSTNFIVDSQGPFMKWVTAILHFPLYWKNTPSQIFLNLAPRDKFGTYQWSYTSVVTQQRLSVGSGLSFFTLAGIFLIAVIFSWSPPEPTIAAGGGGCSVPYQIEINAPSSNKVLCVSETFTMSAHWHDNDNGNQCANNQTSRGLRDGTIISTTGGLRIASGTYQTSTSENPAGVHTALAALTKTVTAFTAGTYSVYFTVTDGASGTGDYTSTAFSVTVKNQPGTPGVLTPTTNSTAAITWAWTDIANEENYQVRDTSNTNKSGALAADSTSWQETGLTPNNSYTRRLYSYATVDSGGCNATGTDATGYTAIETPSSVSFGSITDTSIAATADGSFTNVSTGTSGVFIAESVSSTDSGWMQSTDWSATGLMPNTQYSFTAKARNQNSSETASTAAATTYTLASVPDAPSVSAPSTSTAVVVVHQNGNPTGAGTSGDTEYALHETTTDQYVQADGTLGASADWQTYATWGSASGKTVTGLTPNTTYTFEVKARNADNTETAFSSTASTVTSAETAISNISVGSITSTGAVISWSTNHAASSRVDYGTTVSYGSSTTSATLVTSHSVTLTGLTAGTTYHYKVTSTGNSTAVSSDQTFSTSASGGSLAGPSAVKINNHSAKTGNSYNSIISNTQLPTFSGKAEANSTIKLTIYSDPLVLYTTSDANGNWSVTLDEPLPKGTHTLYIVVTKNGAMTSSSKEAVFTIVSDSYVPIPTILTPTVDEVTTDTAPTITGLARSGNTVRLYLDGALATTVAATITNTGTGSFAYTPTTPLASGNHTLSVEASSGDSFSSRSMPFTFTVHAPIIGPTILRIATINNRAVIAGVGWGDTDVRVYANGKEIDIFYIGGSGVQQFSRTVPVFTAGTYEIRLRAEDNTDALSHFSNSVYYTQNGGTHPPVLTSNEGTYIVQSGDSLWSIAQRVYGDGNLWGNLVRLNATELPTLVTNPSRINVGWELFVK